MGGREQIKKCTKCYEEKYVSYFRKSKEGKYGVHSICKICKSNIEKENRKNSKSTDKIRNKRSYENNKIKRQKEQKIYRDINIDIKREYDKKYRKINKNKISINNKKWREENKEEIKKKKRTYFLKNKGKIYKYMSDYNKVYHKLKPHIGAWRSTLKESLRRLNVLKVDKTVKLLGYSATELKQHLESLFTDGMSWNNYGEWHVDHIKPLSSFDSNTPPHIVNGLSNLQPLWATTREINGVIYEGNLNKGFR